MGVNKACCFLMLSANFYLRYLYLYERMNLFEIHKQFRKNKVSPDRNQTEELKYLCKSYMPKSLDTGVQQYQQFAEAFDVATYSELKSSLLEKRKGLCCYVKTSGTTEASKLLPLSYEYLERNHHRVARFNLFNQIVYQGCPFMMRGGNVGLGGYQYPEEMNGEEVLDVSAVMIRETPYIYKQILFPNEIFGTWKEKLTYFKNHLKTLCNARSISGVPTWMLSLFQEVSKDQKKPVHELFPNLKLIVHGGVHFDHYFDIFNNLFPDRTLKFNEIYNATEGFYGFQLDGDSRDLVLTTNAGIFYEFRERDCENVVPIWQTEIDEIYELIITNMDGLIRYKTGDLIQVKSREPFLFRMVGRTTECMNAFGEDLALAQVYEALGPWLKRFEILIETFFVVPSFQTSETSGNHEWYILFKEDLTTSITTLETSLDELVQEKSTNYKQKRQDDLALSCLRIHVLTEDMLKQIYVANGKIYGGQTKLKKLYNNRTIVASLDAKLNKNE